MQKRVLGIVLFVGLGVSASTPCLAQLMADTTATQPPEQARGDYRLEAALSGGPMWSWFRKERSPGASPGATNGSSFTVRVMWHPDHHLAVGLLSGYQLYAREEIEIDDSTESSPVANARGILSAVPAQVAIEMRKYGVELLLGLGGYITSAILRDSSVVYGRHFELGFLAQLGYDLPVTSRITLVPAVQMNHINFRSVTTFAPSLAIRYELYRY